MLTNSTEGSKLNHRNANKLTMKNCKFSPNFFYLTPNCNCSIPTRLRRTASASGSHSASASTPTSASASTSNLDSAPTCCASAAMLRPGASLSHTTTSTTTTSLSAPTSGKAKSLLPARQCYCRLTTTTTSRTGKRADTLSLNLSSRCGLRARAKQVGAPESPSTCCLSSGGSA